jgi:hypothetical protein
MWTALGHSAASFEGRAVVSRRPTHHNGIVPVAADQSEHPRSHTVAFQEHDAPLPIHSIEGFLKIQEDTVKWSKPKIRELLGQFCLDDGSPCSAFAAAAVEAVVQGDGFQMMVNNPLNALPDRLQ